MSERYTDERVLSQLAGVIRARAISLDDALAVLDAAAPAIAARARQDAGEATRAAETVLASTDPRVLDAMQDALVRAGRLRVDESAAYSDDDGVTWYAMFGRAPSRQPMSRLVTEWREAEK